MTRKKFQQIRAAIKFRDTTIYDENAVHSDPMWPIRLFMEQFQKVRGKNTL